MNLKYGDIKLIENTYIMSIENDFKRGMDFLMKGMSSEAASIFLQLYQLNVNNNFRIQLIDALLASLDPVEENEKLISLSSEGVAIAGQINELGAQAHFMGRKADFLMHKKCWLQYQCTNLKLTPGWFQFSLETEKDENKILQLKIEELEKDINTLLNQAIEISKNTNDKKSLAFVLMCRASIVSARYLQYKNDCILGTKKVKLFNIFHKTGFEIPILYGLKNFKVLRNYIKLFTKDYQEAGSILEYIDDKDSASAYYDLAVHLSTAYNFKDAKKYLNRANNIAGKYKYDLLTAKIKAFRVIMLKRNKDVPNYLVGERRKGVTI